MKFYLDPNPGRRSNPGLGVYLVQVRLYCQSCGLETFVRDDAVPAAREVQCICGGQFIEGQKGGL